MKPWFSLTVMSLSWVSWSMCNQGWGLLRRSQVTSGPRARRETYQAERRNEGQGLDWVFSLCDCSVRMCYFFMCGCVCLGKGRALIRDLPSSVTKREIQAPTNGSHTQKLLHGLLMLLLWLWTRCCVCCAMHIEEWHASNTQTHTAREREKEGGVTEREKRGKRFLPAPPQATPRTA